MTDRDSRTKSAKRLGLAIRLVFTLASQEGLNVSIFAELNGVQERIALGDCAATETP